jgi:hypothetical protein
MQTKNERAQAIGAIAGVLRKALPAEEKNKPANDLEKRIAEDKRISQLVERIEIALRLILPGFRFRVSFDRCY